MIKIETFQRGKADPIMRQNVLYEDDVVHWDGNSDEGEQEPF